MGVYRVPGNAGGVAALAAALDRGCAPAGDPRWADVHVASSLLKAYLRRLPDPLLTHHLYPAFIGTYCITNTTSHCASTVVVHCVLCTYVRVL